MKWKLSLENEEDSGETEVWRGKDEKIKPIKDRITSLMDKIVKLDDMKESLSLYIKL